MHSSQGNWNAQEKNVKSLFEHAPALVAILKGRDGVCELFNEMFSRLWGARDVLNRPMREAWPELEGQGWFETVETVFDTGQPVYGYEKPAIADWNNDGKPKELFFNFVYSPSFADGGQVDGVMIFGFDVTEQVVARKKIEASQSYFKRMANTVPATLWITEKDGSCSYLNQSWYDITGQGSREALGFGWLKATHEDDRANAENTFLEANKNRVPFYAVYRLRQRTGEYRWVVDKGSPRIDEHGEFEGFIGCVIDIHDQIISEERTRESEERFRLLATTIPQVVWTSRPDGQLEYLSEQWVGITGQSITDAFNSGWATMVHENDVEVVNGVWRDAIQGKKGWQAEYRLKNLVSGTYRWFQGETVPLKDQNGNVLKWVGAATDIHSFKEHSQVLEEKVRQRTQELQFSNENLQQFAHVASHDLKEPLRKIKTFAELLKSETENLLPPRAKVHLEKITIATDRMINLVEGVLNYSTTNSLLQQKEQIDLNGVIASIEFDLEILIQQRSATLIYKDLPTIEGAPILVLQLFYNLVNNSLKFSHPERNLMISISSTMVTIGEREFAHIIIKDNGIGFEQKYADRIFDTFARLHSKDKFEGTGLGLSLCKKIVLRHDGEMFAKGVLDVGAEFHIQLPLKQIRTEI